MDKVNGHSDLGGKRIFKIWDKINHYDVSVFKDKVSKVSPSLLNLKVSINQQNFSM